jgi:hypothetical protein
MSAYGATRKRQPVPNKSDDVNRLGNGTPDRPLFLEHIKDRPLAELGMAVGLGLGPPVGSTGGL